MRRDTGGRRCGRQLGAAVDRRDGVLRRFVGSFMGEVSSVFARVGNQVRRGVGSFNRRRFGGYTSALRTLASGVSSLSANLLRRRGAGIRRVVTKAGARLRSMSGGIAMRVASLYTRVASTLTGLHSDRSRGLASVIRGCGTLSRGLTDRGSSFTRGVGTRFGTRCRGVRRRDAGDLRRVISLGSTCTRMGRGVLRDDASVGHRMDTRLHGSLSAFMASLRGAIASRIGTLDSTVIAGMRTLRGDCTCVDSRIQGVGNGCRDTTRTCVSTMGGTREVGRDRRGVLSAVGSDVGRIIRAGRGISRIVTMVRRERRHVRGLVSRVGRVDAAVRALRGLRDRLGEVTGG